MKRLGKQRSETWQIYTALKNGSYKSCLHCQTWDNKESINITCPKCKSVGKIKTPWYNHPIVQMWKEYEDALLQYGMEICLEWIRRGYKDTLYLKFLAESYCRDFNIKYPKWMGDKDFHAAMRSNLLRKNKKYYSQFGWKEPDNLPYVWIK